jgi:hypothetical protein
MDVLSLIGQGSVAVSMIMAAAVVLWLAQGKTGLLYK